MTHACWVMGTSRDSFYRIKERYHTGGEEALREISCRNRFPKRVAPEMEAAVVEMAVDYPANGQARVSNEPEQKGLLICISR